MSLSARRFAADHADDVAFVSGVTADCDPAAVAALNDEIAEAVALGHDIRLAPRADRAYEQPERIRAVHDRLKTLDVDLAAYRAELLGPRGGRSILGRLRSRNDRMLDDRAVSELLEVRREETLFGPGGVDAMAWHYQRGRAPALGTIVDAHELATIESGHLDGRYRTMSARLTTDSLSYRFRHAPDDFRGFTVREALTRASMDFGRRSPELAAAKAQVRVAQFEEFLGAPNSRLFKEVVAYCTDGLGIRARRDEVNRAVTRHVDQCVASGQPPSKLTMLSFGCGTAQPVLEGLAEIKATHSASPRLILLDQDPLALAAAATLAESMGLDDSVEIHCRRLFSRVGRPLDLAGVLQGRTVDIAEDSGLREYLPDAVYRRLTAQTWRVLRDGGLMSTGNMNANRPQAEFLHGMMGWQPTVQMRSIADGFRLHRAAGVPVSATRAVVTGDGVYTLYFSQKVAAVQRRALVPLGSCSGGSFS